MRSAPGHLVLRRRVSGFAVLQMWSFGGDVQLFFFFGLGKRLALANRAGTHISLLLLYRTLVVRFLRALGADLAIQRFGCNSTFNELRSQNLHQRMACCDKKKALCDIQQQMLTCLHYSNTSALLNNEQKQGLPTNPHQHQNHRKKQQNHSVSRSHRQMDKPPPLTSSQTRPPKRLRK
jgi:hypothetical protein